jgi:hypothetical protein
VSRLRVYVNVPQAFADRVKIGTEGDLALDEFPARKFPDGVTNTARASTQRPERLFEAIHTM